MRYTNTLGTRFSGRGDAGINTMVFQKNGRTRAYVTPANPQTADQIATRQAFSFLSGEWSATLTDAERLAWEASRASGVFQTTDALTGTTPNYASAKDLFIALNYNATVLAGAALSVVFTEPPALSPIEPITVSSVVIDASAGTAVVTYTGTLSDGVLVVRATNPLPEGYMKARKSAYRNVLASAAVSPIDAGAAYVAKFGAITGAAGKVVFLQVVFVGTDDGRTLTLYSERLVIQA